MSVLGDLATPPPATRAVRPGWRDPRLWIGVALVAVSVVAGARLLAAADDSVAVWAAADDLAAGHELTGDDLTSRRVRFVAADDLARYLPADEALPADTHLLREVGAGELVPRTAIGAVQQTGLLALPLAVEPALVPPGVEVGAVVNVYVSAAGRCSGCAGPALADVTVAAAPARDELTGTRQLVVNVEERQADRWFALISGLDSPVVTVASRG
ncbi:hypothetical protein [Nocardioides coralli]|uniref:hypothetical protein n=1 Tax=Nocardioides coralli TaxID=2872154 RepID=UPI001CA4252E|nr:hypothetical protein [Nocardioides coralli]QZY28456.1 hypothetical protein K6T13_13415 [Nocardioides coralli]